MKRCDKMDCSHCPICGGFTMSHRWCHAGQIVVRIDCGKCGFALRTLESLLYEKYEIICSGRTKEEREKLRNGL